MVLVSKIVLSVLLTILAALMQFKGGNCALMEFEGNNSDSLFSITIDITNNLTGNLQLGVHCKDKHHDLGFQTLVFRQTYSFKVEPMLFFGETLYFCQFNWISGDHYFDIYDQKRDTKIDFSKKLLWEINDTGPCKILGMNPQCYNWNPNALIAGRQLDEGNNTLNV